MALFLRSFAPSPITNRKFPKVLVKASRLLPSQSPYSAFQPSSTRQSAQFSEDTPLLSSRNVLAFARRGFFSEIADIDQDKNAAGPVEFSSPLKILLYPDPILRVANKKVNVFDDNLKRLVSEMFDIMYNTDGVGLAAPQVGVNIRLMVYNPIGERGKGKEYVLVNPKIQKFSKESDISIEGCLSFPAKSGVGTFDADVKRALGVKVSAQDIEGKPFSLTLKGWQARVFQHEYDHLEGKLFLDRMSPSVLQTALEGLEVSFALHFGEYISFDLCPFQKNQESKLTPGLYLVGTPIGNLEDMTFRGIRILKEVDLVLAEDTRHSGRLLQHFGIKTEMMSYHKFNQSLRRDPIIRRLQGGESMALISDAGMPAISDPGSDIVAACVENNIPVTPIPGPCAVVAAMSASGFTKGDFTF